MRGWLARVRSFWAGYRKPERLSAEMEEEMRFHIEQEAERIARTTGVAREEALRQATVAFGGIEQQAEHGRDVRGVSRAHGLSLDLRIAWRMLRKSPGLTVVGVLGTALAIGMGVGFYQMLSAHIYPSLPFEEGERIVSLEHWDVARNEPSRPSMAEYLAWREQLRAVEDVAAFTMGYRELLSGDAPPQRVGVAALSASGFHAVRVAPLLGRYLALEDEVRGAEPVAVLGHDLWQSQFGGDPQVLGRRVFVGDEEHTVVGVMPPGFGFPRSQELWLPLRADATQVARAGAAELFVFGRITPGFTPAQAQAELATVVSRAAASAPAAAPLRARVVPYTKAVDQLQDMQLWDVARMQLLVLLLLSAIIANVSVLVYARTAMRRGEIAVRAALGATRARLVGQLFVEAIVLSLVGAALGVLIVQLALGQLQRMADVSGGLAFWVDYTLRLDTLLYATALAVLAAVIIGVLPALKSTGRSLYADFRGLGSGATPRLGRIWTCLIVMQVAVAVAALPVALQLGFRELVGGAVRPTFPAREFLSVNTAYAMPLRAGIDAATYRRESATRYALRIEELERRLEADPAVAGVTFKGRAPGWGPLVQVDGDTASAALRLSSRSTGVALDYFDVLGVRLRAGRELGTADASPSATAIVVNEAFVRRVLNGGEAIGRHVRFVEHPQLGQPDPVPGPWREIVGVVPDLLAGVVSRDRAPPEVYYAVTPVQLRSAELLVRSRSGETDALALRARQAARALDPDLRLLSVSNLAALESEMIILMLAGMVAFLLLTVILLSAAGIHALMSLAVTRRRREIGIRTALGAQPVRLLGAIFSRAAGQLGLGALLGTAAGTGLLVLFARTTVREASYFIAAVLVLMLAAGLLAALGPARRGMRVPPIEALRSE